MLDFKCHAILFDMDGVLVDSTACVERHWHAWATKHGLDYAQVMSISHGQRTIDTMSAVASHLGLDLLEEAALFDHAETVDLEGVVAMPGALELLMALPPESWAIFTSATSFMATTRLEATGLPIPRAFITAEKVSQGKPHPEGYLKAARILGADPRDCLVIEDAPAGIKAARAGAIPVLALATTFPAERLLEANFVTAGLHTVHLNNIAAQALSLPEIHLRISLI